jgi:protein disulfide-isomerase A6
VIGDVDCTVEESLCSEYEVRGYPTLKYFTAETGKEGAPYEGARALDDLKSFVEETLEIKCAVDDAAQCSEKEQAYIEKMKAKSPEEVDAALKRLDGMIGGSMKPELKQWIVQRARILRQMQSA